MKFGHWIRRLGQILALIEVQQKLFKASSNAQNVRVLKNCVGPKKIKKVYIK